MLPTTKLWVLWLHFWRLAICRYIRACCDGYEKPLDELPPQTLPYGHPWDETLVVNESQEFPASALQEPAASGGIGFGVNLQGTI